MKTIKTNKFPSLIFNNIESAKAYNLEVCKIKFNGAFMGYGLYDEGKLLESKDFTSV